MVGGMSSSTGVLSVLLLLLPLLVEATEKPTTVKLAEAQVDWAVSNGGYMSPKISIAPIYESDSDNVPLGMFAKEAFSKGETIMVVPRKCLLTVDSEDMCDTAELLLEEHNKGEKSFFAPYIAYLFNKAGDHGEGEPIPSSWSLNGRKLLLDIRGPHLPPKDLTTVTFQNNCDGTGEDELEEFAYRTVVSRAWNDKLVPLLDMINHQSGRYTNVDSTRVQGNTDDITVFATRDIAANEELFLSYMDCADQKGYENEYVLPHMLRDFGYIDRYPQRWTFPGRPGSRVKLVFDLDFIDDKGIISWRTKEPNDEQMLFLKQELSRLKNLEEYVNATLDQLDSDNERNVTLEYYKSLTTALKLVTKSLDGSQTCTDSETCHEEHDEGRPEDWLACEDYRHAPLKHNYEVQSSYQTIEIRYAEENDDACLYMDGWLHTCASYRPHYHEVLVHYASRFLDEIKRVIFIGGGDSMVISEVLKYPSLELVVGMELDQEVIRASFRSFGSQPFYDDPRAQWYLGDGAKTMSVLPREYYGSFDLVLLDIQTEVAASLRVNDDLNLLEAAMLLMKPDGIIVKNEDEGYVPGSEEGFTKYSLDLVYHDVPMYCLQEIVLGSNTIDFLTATPKDHGVETLYLEGVDTFQSQFDSWYNYGTGGTGKPSYCNKQEQMSDIESNAADTSLGVLMILEAEDTAVALESTEALRPAIVKVLNDNDLVEKGFTSSPLSKGGLEGFSLVVHVGEPGYIAARCFPAIQYCGFDIHVYGDSIAKLETIKTQLLSAVQSNRSSVYRFVTQGMAFAKSGDQKSIGPPSANELCQDEPDDKHQEASPPGTRIRKKKTAAEFGPPRPSTLHSYDHRPALLQWESQKVIGAQMMMQFVISSSSDSSSASDLLNEGIDTVLKKPQVQKQVLSNAVGDGLAIFASWTDGSLVATFDGSSRVDINLFTLSTEFDVDKAIFDVEEEIGWDGVIVEYFPRGTGSVVSFPDEIEDIEHPFWA